jgi:hypothetical protein
MEEGPQRVIFRKRFPGPLLALLLGASPALAVQAERRAAPPSSSCAVIDEYLHIGDVSADAAVPARPAAGGRLPLEYLIATIPDPNDARLTYLFERHLDAILVALAMEGYVRDREVPLFRSAAASPGSTLGVILLRPESPRARGQSGRSPLLVLLLVPEKPTFGVDKPSLAAALNCACSTSAARLPIRVLGPTFSGSARSIAIVLDHWQPPSEASESYEKARAQGPVFRVVSGSATNRNTKAVLEKSGRATYGATVHADDRLSRMLAGYLRGLRQPGRHVPGSRHDVAILTEFTTSYGQGFLDPKELGAIVLPFPLHIASLLGEKVESATGKKSTAPQKDKDKDKEKEPAEEPTLSEPARASARLALAQLLTTINLEEIRYVGLVATDVNDKLFLAREIRQFCPDVRLFTYESDVLFTDRAWSDVLRGMLVVSTYPLFNENQTWTARGTGSQRRIQFVSDAAQGIYNATLLLLNEKEHLLEYARPEPARATPSKAATAVPERSQPPVWLSVVGSGSLWPLRIESLFDDYLEPAGEIAAAPAAGEPNDIPRTFHLLVLLVIAFAVLSSAWYFFGPSPNTFARSRLPLPTLAHRDSPYAPTQVAFLLFHLVTLALLLFVTHLLSPAVGTPIQSLRQLFAEEGHWPYAVLFVIAAAAELLAILAAGSMLVRAFRGTRSRTPGRRFGLRQAALVLLAGALVVVAASRLVDAAVEDDLSLLALFRVRTSHLSSGVSALAPVFLLSVFVYLSLMTYLSFRAAYESFEAGPRLDAAVPSGDTSGILILRRTGWPVAFVLLQVTCFVAMLLAARFFYLQFLPTFESTGLDRALRFFFVAPPALLSLLFIDVLARWTSLRETLSPLAADPLFAAETADANPFARFLPRRGKPFFSAAPLLAEVERAVKALRALEPKSPGSDPDAPKPAGKADARRRRLYDELQQGVRKLLAAQSPRSPAADDVVRAGVVYMLRVRFSCLRKRLLIPLLGMPILLLALMSYPFEPRRLLLLPLSLVLLAFVCGTLALFIDMERNFVVSRISGTTAGKVTLNGDLILKIVIFTVPALFALAGSRLPAGGNTVISWIQDLLNVLK